jgi:hypothetical protein
MAKIQFWVLISHKIKKFLQKHSNSILLLGIQQITTNRNQQRYLSFLLLNKGTIDAKSRLNSISLDNLIIKPIVNQITIFPHGILTSHIHLLQTHDVPKAICLVLQVK